MSTDIIAAIATAPGRGAVGILRLSGAGAAAVAMRVTGNLPPARRTALRKFRGADGAVIDQGIVLYFPAPQSFTGEEIVELQAHGGPVVLDLLLRELCAAGARLARPGEFSERAFLNGRLDLTQAEAIADLIDAGSEAAVKAASRSLEGEFSRRCHGIVEELVQLRADLEAALDFADEEVPWISSESLTTRLQSVQQQLRSLLDDAGQGRRLREGMTVAIAGRPNVGKSTLLNRLTGVDVAIVSPVAGTTRDVLREHIIMDGLPLTIVDTAGLRETDDPVEREGVARALAALERAELALVVVDDSETSPEDEQDLFRQLPCALPTIIVRNKCDLTGQAPGRVPNGVETVEVRLSAATGSGCSELRKEIREIAGLRSNDSSLFSARTRHVEALRLALRHLLDAEQAAPFDRAELIAEELRQAQRELDIITGRFTPDDLLGRIFASFCLGK